MSPLILLLAMSTLTIIDYNYISTPNNTLVEVWECQEASSQDIAQLNIDADAFCSQNVRLYTATNHFNCHSYAWYSQEVNDNPFWMNDPTAYYSDGSYYEITNVSEVIARDRICYFDSDGNNLHSGIVRYATGSNISNGVCGYSDLFYVQSKWGQAGLYEHRGDLCPYPYDLANPAVTVKFYRRNLSHTHSITYSEYSDSRHTACCSTCGMLYLPHNFTLIYNGVPHIYEPNYMQIYVCTDCGYLRIGNPSL